MVSPPPALEAGVQKTQITLLYIRSFVYYICVHLLNIYRNISQNNTISYSNNELLPGTARLSNSAALFKQFLVGQGRGREGLPIFGLFASDFTHPLKEKKKRKSK